MKILHTADWHLGKRLERFDRLAEQQAVLEEICALAQAEGVDAILVAGDLFDTYNPSSEATEIFYRYLKRMADNGRRAVVAIAGNHDSPDRIDAPDPLARECGIVFAGYPLCKVPPFMLESGLGVLRAEEGFVELQLPGQAAPLRLLLTPYANENRLRRALGGEDPGAAMRAALREHWLHLAETYCDTAGVNVLLTHLYMVGAGEERPEEPEDEKPVLVGGAGMVFTDCVPPQIQYTALGHLHRHQNMGGGPCPCVYASSPLGYSFAEAGQEKYVVIVEVEPGQPAQWRKVGLKAGYPLQRVAFPSADAAVGWLLGCPDCYAEVTLDTETYIQSEDRKRILDAHPRVIGPIPRFKDLAALEQARALADPTRALEDLFRDYFVQKTGQQPSDEVMGVFAEILAQEGGAA